MTDTIIVGCGYVGSRLARRYLDRGLGVTGVVRSEDGVARLVAEGIPARRCDLARDEPDALPFEGAQLFYLAPPPNQGVEDSSLGRLVDAFERVGHPKRVLYLSTTGVYGDCQGAWVDETHPTEPTQDRSRRRLNAEDRLRAWSRSSGAELVVLRVGGIYGPGRLPLDRIRRAVPMVRADEAPYTNRIHVEDLVEVCVAAMDNGVDGAIYNVSDGHPSSMTDYFMQVAEAAGLEPPPLISLAEADGQLSAGMMSYMGESRRLSNRKLREELGVELRYPTLIEGLCACGLA
ncbi:NAD-dependent epimerase/dehydratase [Thiorhodococcus drewsii AZ1]|uniref:NAD-dependent epimerase/dehydratase n=1 Tax=Thiorhodococcus drewsii AZ1 TaxID=765913 RepID=G2DZ92_9GAMM|nr:SDR family oxidoreductase [Thiorhodococcus drewsii]EGV32446.1 NAD-dependent epimerase/dehydratase [Thiorhodococcus drewsii AZ1]